jgi:VWFA-related protein
MVLKQNAELLIFSFIALFIASTTKTEAQSIPTFRGGVSLGYVDVELLGSHNRPVTGLSKDELQVLDNGQEQAILAITEGDQPLDLILLFDISGSMRKKIRDVAAVAHEALKELRKQDRVQVSAFTTISQVVLPFSEDLFEVEQAIRRVLSLDYRGGTRIQDAVNEAALSFLRNKDRDRRRRAVLVITDNYGRPSYRKASIIENVWEANALICGLIVPNLAGGILGPLSGAVPGRIGGIDDLVEESGGDIIHTADVRATFPEMVHRIRSRYTLYYRLPEGQLGSLRKISVGLSDKGRRRFDNARVLAKRGYRVREHDRSGFSMRED